MNSFLVFVASLLATLACTHADQDLVLVTTTTTLPVGTTSKKNDDDPYRLSLCDCYPASGDPGGLSCDKEGFFISSFERQGQWVAGGGAVPLSRAICCRPCLPSSPSSLPDDFPEDDQPVALVSLGCHPSTDPLGIRCEATAPSSLIAGFTDSVRVFSAVDTQYPVDTAQCCTPAVLMASGDAWELERCGCGPTSDTARPVGCGDGNVTDHALLSGFDFFRVSPLGQIVPVGPARCCGVCMSSRRHPATDCADVGHCSGHGVCLLGRCECLDGWGGSDCSHSLADKRSGGKIPPWAIALIVIGSSLLAMALLSVGAYITELLYEARSREGSDDEEDEEGRRPLLLRIDADDAGSVGSRDTNDGGVEGDVEGVEVEERIEGVRHQLEDDEEESESLDVVVDDGTGDGAGGEEDIEEDLPGSSTPSLSTSPNILLSTSTAPTAEQQPAPQQPPQQPQQQEERGLKPANASILQSYVGVGPLSSVDCVVCMTRPVQTVVVPCGHVCMCRRCSRRLHRCPICRKDIARRQRLYV